jgi:hypothetical protein
MSIQKSTEGVGYPSRNENLDVLTGFISPPEGYGEVAFYWWLGDPLTKERITWQLDRLKDRGVIGLQVNYAHCDKGGRTYGLTYPSDPPLFSEEWWELFCWFLQESKKRGMSVSLSDYTLGIAGQGWYIDEIINENPSIKGATLDCKMYDVIGESEFSCEIPDNVINVIAYKIKNDVIESGFDIKDKINNNSIRWNIPEGNWRIAVIFMKPDPLSLDPMNPLSGAKVIETFFQRFEDRNPGESGKSLNYFFSDELQFGVVGKLWNNRFADEFAKRKGYDIIPELPALFMDIGSRTPKIRLDYWDVLVSLEEECYFRPIYDWHDQRKMLYGCDHGGRGLDIVEFGDYYRTQRWMQCPGNDSPNLSADIIKNKVASSITHLYNRPRTWLEGYHSSGWGTSSAQVADATFRNFIMGHNMLSLHGLYYSTYGGWWEWAPPCNHFRMPYWEHSRELLKCFERLCYLLSQGHHRCDVALMYPVEAMQSGMNGNDSVNVGFTIGRYLFERGIDFDFMDSESLDRAEIENGELKISGEPYRVLILPAMKAIKYSNIQKALEFYRKGGIVIAFKCVPESSDRIGDNDPELDVMVKELFSPDSKNSFIVQNWEDIIEIIDGSFSRDFACISHTLETAKPQVLHRKIGNRDVYMVYGAPKNSECFFRAKGKVELWDPWTGEVKPIYNILQNLDGTKVTMPLDANEAQLIVFSPGEPIIKNIAEEKESMTISLDGKWEFELTPILDNRWGDYRLPAFDGMIGAEAQRFRYIQADKLNPDWKKPDFDDSSWKEITYSFGQYLWKLGPLPDIIVDESNINPETSTEINGKLYHWEPYNYSMRWGIEGDPGHQGYHGLKGNVTDDFIALGKKKQLWASFDYEKEDEGSIYLWTSASVEKDTQAKMIFGEVKPLKIWINGTSIDTEIIKLKSGKNTILLRYDQPCRTHFVLEYKDSDNWAQTYPLAMNWYNNPNVIAFDAYPDVRQSFGCYRFISPPGLSGMTINARGKVKAYANDDDMSIQLTKKNEDGSCIYEAIVQKPSPSPVQMVIVIEHERGYYGGSALPEPIKLHCAKGQIEPGDWAKIDGLASYSGGACYQKSFEIDRIGDRMVLDMGDVVSSAEVFINAKFAGIKVAPSWKLDITKFVNIGENHVKIIVYNTLANHYLTIPTRYRGSSASGIMGPVDIRIFDTVRD